ncbi:hypothetical protein FRC03_006251 [Tulasnella sp. 419]|nr:hypothetical protein FRC03_006251 [Tulasnella sp. 419]
MGDFTSVPIIDYKMIAHGEKGQFLKDLRQAFVNVGFCYLKNPPIDNEVVKRLVEFTPKFFDLSPEKKAKIGMINSPHFLGYAGLGSERTKGAADLRELCDFATPYKSQWKEGDPDFLRLWGDSQWPDEDDIPDFKPTVLSYLSQVERLSLEFVHLLAESLYIPQETIDRYYCPNLQHRCKLAKYHVLDPIKGNQGVGPHFDGGFLTFVSLENGGSLKSILIESIVASSISTTRAPGPEPERRMDRCRTNSGHIGGEYRKRLETVTRGVARATAHRVVSPLPEYGPRYSIPFFQNISPTARVSEIKLYEDGIPGELEEMVKARGDVGPTDSVNYAEYGREQSGLAQLIARIKSHPDVGKRHYPTRYRDIFGDKEPGVGAFA